MNASSLHQILTPWLAVAVVAVLLFSALVVALIRDGGRQKRREAVAPARVKSQSQGGGESSRTR
jgi:hypothetical protein